MHQACKHSKHSDLSAGRGPTRTPSNVKTGSSNGILFLEYNDKIKHQEPPPQTKYDIRSGTPPQLGKAVGPLCPCHTRTKTSDLWKRTSCCYPYCQTMLCYEYGEECAALRPPQSLWLGELNSRLGVKIPFQGDIN